MGWDKIGSLIGGVAPVLGSLVGGPLGGVAGKLLSDVFMPDQDPAKVEPDALYKQIVGNPEWEAELLRIERNNQEEMERLRLRELEMRIEHQKAIYSDRANARATMRRSWVPPFLTLLVTVAFFGICYMLLTGAGVPQGNNDILYLLLGAVVVVWKDCCAYYVGGVGGNQVNEKEDRHASK